MKADINVDGLKELISEFSTMSKDARKVARVALQSSMKVIAAEMANQLDPRVKEVGKSVGYRLTIYRGNVTKAKVGFNVGKGAVKRRVIRKRTTKGGGDWFSEPALVHSRYRCTLHGQAEAPWSDGRLFGQQRTAVQNQDNRHRCISWAHARNATGAGGECVQRSQG